MRSSWRRLSELEASPFSIASPVNGAVSPALHTVELPLFAQVLYNRGVIEGLALMQNLTKIRSFSLALCASMALATGAPAFAQHAGGHVGGGHGGYSGEGGGSGGG